MKAKIRPRIDLENRTNLHTVIPLSTPFIINVDPSDLCNFRCKFCPTGDRPLMKKTPGRNHGIMTFELYKKIIDDICKFEKPIKVLRLYKDGEPLLNPRLPEMIRYAKEKRCAERIDTTTNGSLLSQKMNTDLIAAGLDRINISIEGVNAKQYWDFSKYRLNFKNLLENISHLYAIKSQCRILIKINGDTLTQDDKNRFYELFGNITDDIFIEHIMACWPKFHMNGLLPNKEFGIYGQEIREVQVCPYIFYSFSINSDGRASACFLDWERKLLVGDAKTESVKDIWNSSLIRNLQIMFLRNRRKSHPICSNCGQMSHGLPDDIDNHAAFLLQRMTK